MAQPLWKKFKQFLIKLNIVLPNNPALEAQRYLLELNTHIEHKNWAEM